VTSPEQTVKEKTPHYLGHRQRLRERLLKSGADSVQDYELLEVLLFAALLVTGKMALRAQKEELVGGALLNNWQRMVDYCRMAMPHKTIEQFRLLFLDRKNRLLSE
jgi:DNA repair protein RadC